MASPGVATRNGVDDGWCDALVDDGVKSKYEWRRRQLSFTREL